MAAMDVQKLQAVMGKAAQQYERWQSQEAIICRLLANAGNIIDRLPALQDGRNYKELVGCGPELQELLLSKQMRSLENVFKRMQDALQELQEVVRVQEKLCVEAWALLGSSPSIEACAKPQLSSAISAAQMVEAMEDVWYMCRDELCLKAGLLAGVHHGMSNQEFAEVQALFQANVNMRPQSTSALLLSC